MSRFQRIKRAYIIHFINKYLSGTRFFKLKRKLLNEAGISCGENTCVVGPLCVGNVSKVNFGRNVWIGRNFTIYGNGEVLIGDCVDIAPDVEVLTGSHLIAKENHRAGEGMSYKVKISNGSWIGARATILGNVEIGNGCVIGACALINRSTEANTMYAGIPGRRIRDL